MNKIRYWPFVLLFITIAYFFSPFLLQGKLPIPSDTIVGLYHPFRDLYAKDYPNGIPYKNSLITDPVRQQYPWRYLAIEQIKQGQLPLWNPYSLSGTPLLGNFQNAAFYPLNIFFFLLPFGISWSLLVMLEPFLSGIFMILFLRKLRLSAPAAFLGGFTYAFSGFSVAWMEWNTVTQVIVWLPLILLAKEYLLEKMTWKWLAVLLFAEISAIFAGHLQVYFYALCLSDIYLFARILQITLHKHGKESVPLYFAKKSLPYLVIGLVILAITLIVWWPTAQFILQSGRNLDQLNNWQKVGWFIPWQNLIQFFAPDFFGNPTTLNYWGVWNYGEFIGYIGLFPLFMAIFALFYRHDKKTFLFGSLFFLSLIFSLPTFFAQIPYILNIPFLVSTQPTRLLFVTDFSLSILAALGFDMFLKNSKKNFWPLGFIVGIFILLWLTVTFGSKAIPDFSAANSSVAKHNLYFPTILILLILISVGLLTSFKDKKNRYAVIGFLLLITVVDLLRFGQKFTPFTSQAYLYPQTATLSYLQQQPGQFRVMSTDSRIFAPNFSVLYHLQTIDGYDPLYLERYAELVAAMERKKPDITPPFGFNRIITPQDVDAKFINLLGVKYIMSFDDYHSPQLHLISQEGKTKLYENTTAYPRAFLVQHLIVSTTKQSSINALFDSSINLADTAVVEGWGNPKLSFAKGSASIIKYTSHSVVITTKTDGDGFLVLTDVYYPTWHAEVCSNSDCHATPIYMTDYAFRGIEVPAGEHTVRITSTL